MVQTQHLGRLTPYFGLPELVDRPQLVLRTGPETVEPLETDRRAEPLRDATLRVMAEDLSRLLASDLVSSYPQAAALTAELRKQWGVAQ